MIVSWNWLQQYVPLDMPIETLTDRLTMTGLNLESIEPVGGDSAIDLEVTSNRPDCLGHIGVAREASVLFEQPLTIPAAQPAATAEKTAQVCSVAIECDDLCPRYFARVIRGVKIGPSPDWLRQRLETVGTATINNVVDITNYVLMECGQPLHAFDFDRLQDGQIIVRRAQAGESIVAIDQRKYELSAEMCVIADSGRPVAIAGVMGGLDTEIGEQTVNVLIETAEFAPLAVRNTARTLNLHSPSSYRFERGIDPQNLDWASRRCCELILALAGGELLDEPVVAGSLPTGEAEPVRFRFAQIERILGIEIPRDQAIQILTSLGLEQVGDATAEAAEFVPPSWRRDLTREIDLLEEVARIYGYERIPEDAFVPLTVSAKTLRDRVGERLRHALTGLGFYEAITMSFVSREQYELFNPRVDVPALQVEHSSRKQENVLRQSLVPSLLQSRRENERHGNFNARLFEIARAYLKADPERPESQPLLLSFVTGGSFADVKGIVELLADTLNHEARVTVRPSTLPSFVAGRGAEVLLNGRPWGWLGELSRETTDRLDLRDAVAVAELDLSLLEEEANLRPVFSPIPRFPAMGRDLNFVLDETVTWEQLERTVAEAAGPLMERVRFADQYRGPQIPSNKKSYVFTLEYRSPERTLTAEEVDRAQESVIAACTEKLGAALR